MTNITGGSAVLFFLVCIITGSCYLSIYNISYGTHYGTLKEAKVIPVTLCDGDRKNCDNDYYVGMIYRKGDINVTETCTVQRAKYYWGYGDAQNRVDQLNENWIGSRRTIYETAKPGECYDKALREYYTMVGIIVLVLPFAILFLIGMFILYCEIREGHYGCLSYLSGIPNDEQEMTDVSRDQSSKPSYRIAHPNTERL